MSAASGCCASAGRSWSGGSRTCWKPAGCAGWLCAGNGTSSNECWFTRPPRIWDCSCATVMGSIRLGACKGGAAASMATVGQAATAVYLFMFLGLGRLVSLVTSIFGPTRPANQNSPLRAAIQRQDPGTAKIGPETISATGC